MEKTFGLIIWIFILVILRHMVHAQVCELDSCPAGERCFVRTAFGGTPYVCECTPPGGIGFDCSNTDIPYNELFTCYGRECTSNTFATPNFPSAYPTNYRAIFLIFVPGGEEITFQLGFPYDIGPGDFLFVGRGLDFTPADLASPSIPGEFYVFGSDDGTFQPFTLLGDAFWLYFVSDGDNSAQAQGFGILWTARMITNQGPEILNCPEDIFLTLETPDVQIPFTWVEPTSSDPTATITSNRSPGDAFDVPSTTEVTYTFTNDQGVSTCRFIITLTSATADRPPMITNCPQPITEFADEAFSGAFIDWRAPDVTDDSPGMLDITQSHIPPEFFAIGEHMVTYTYTDSAGNSDTCSFIVTVIDITPPSFNNCPSDISNTASSTNGAIVQWQRPSATDNSAQVTVTGNFESGNLFNVGVTTVRYTAVDNSGNDAICQFTVTISLVGNTGVTISNCPQDITVMAENGATFMFVTWTPPTGQDANGQNIVPTGTFQPGSFFRVGTETLVRYTFLGSGGQSDVCSFTIRVVAGVDMGLRVEGCSNNILELAPIGFNFVTVTWTEPTAVDQFGVTYQAEGSLMSGSYFEIGTTTRVTYNFMDNVGNTATCSFTVTVEITGGQLNVEGCPNIPIRETVPSGSSTVPVFWTPPTVSENAVNGVQVLSNFQPGDLFPPGETTVTYSFTDSVGSTGICSFTVIVSEVQDNEPPTVVCPNDIVRSIPLTDVCTQITWEIPFVNDNSGGVVNTVSAPVSGTCFMVNSVTNVVVTATDPSRNTNSCQFTVTVTASDVVDHMPPFVLCPNDIVRNIPIEQGCSDVMWDIPFVIDDSGEVTVTSTHPSGTCFDPGMTNVMVTAVDPSGNTDMCSFIVNIMAIDSEQPTLTCPDDIVRDITVTDECVNVSWEIPFVSDNSGGTIEVLSTPVSGSCFFSGTTINVLVTAEDAQGNLASCQFSVTVIAIDTIPPTVICPSDIIQDIPVEQPCIQVTWEVPFFNDNSGGPVSISSTTDSGSCIFDETTVVTVTATDPAGNENTCNFVITLRPVDNEPPTVICPNGISRNIPVLQPCMEVSWTIPFFTDNSGDMVVITSTPPSGSCLPAGMTTVTVTATDPSGNENSCSFVVNLEEIDTEPPSLQCPQDISQTIFAGQQCTEVTWQIPFFSDNSGQDVTITSVPPSGTCFSDSATVVTVTAVDLSNNINTCTFVVTISQIDLCTPNPCFNGGTCLSSPTNDPPFTCICVTGFAQSDCSQDTQPPSIVCPQDISVTVAIVETCAVVTWETPQASDNSGNNVIVVSSPQSGTCFEPGTTTVQVIASDQSGNIDQCTFDVNVFQEDPCTQPNPCFNGGTCLSTPANNPPFICLCVPGFAQNDCSQDTQPPSVVCPQDISVTLATGETCAVVTWETPQASDNSGNNVIVVSSPQSGACFGPGTMTVQVTASDQSGNIEQCTFDVNVLREDTTPPTLVCPQNMEQVLNDGCTVFEWTIPFAVDIGGGQVDTMSNPPSGTCFESGVTTVVVTATDASGNDATCSFTVAVIADIDNIPPVVICPQNIRETLIEGSCVIVEWVIPFSVDDQAGPVTEISAPPSGSCLEVGRTDITVSATDSAGNSADCTFVVEIVQVVDTTPPVIQNCPTGDVEVTLPPGESCTPIIWMEPTAVDEDGQPPLVMRFPSQPDCFSIGEILFTYIFTDQAGNIAFCTFSVVITVGQVVDNTDPTVLTCPSNANGVITTIDGCVEVVWTPPIATDDSVGVLQGVPNFEPGSCFTEGSTTVMYIFTDPSGNMAICTFEVIVMLIDNEPPEVTQCPDDISLEALTDNCSLVFWIVPQAVDNTGRTVTVETEFTPGQCFPLGMTTVIYTFRDPSGNAAVCRFVVTITNRPVVVNTAPSMPVCPTVPPVPTLLVIDGNIVSWTIEDCTDAQDVSITPVCNPMSSSFFNLGSTPVTCTCTDSGGLSTECSFNAVVNPGDVIPPTIPDCPNDIILDAVNNDQCVPISWIEPVGMDEGPGPVTIRDQTHFPGDCFSTGQTSVTYVLRDAAGNTASCTFNICVSCIDPEPPMVLDCPIDIAQQAGPDRCTRVFWNEPFVLDVELCVRTSNFVPLDCFFTGEHIVIYTFACTSRNSAFCQFTVNISPRDTEPPMVLNCPNDITEQVGPDNSCTRVFWNEPFGLDAELGLAMTTRNFAPGDCFNIGVNTVTYTFTDTSGNSAICQFTVNISPRDFIPPDVINCPGDITLQGLPGTTCTPVTWTVPTVIDNLPGEIDTFSSSSPGDCFPPGPTTVFYRYTDVAGNTASCTFVIFIIFDNTPPVISNCPNDITQQAAPGARCAVIFWSEPLANDVESGIPSLERNFIPGMCFDIGTTEVVYTFTDTAGNEAVCRFRISISQVIDFTPPVIRNCPSDITIPSLSIGACQTIVWIEPTATDDVPGDIAVMRSHEPGDCFPLGVTMVTYTFTDAAGNRASCAFIVTVNIIDTTPPQVSNCPSDIFLQAPTAATCLPVVWIEPTAVEENGGTVSTETSHSPGDCFPFGTSIVTYTFSDVDGNNAVCRFIINIIPLDNNPPVINNCPDDITLESPATSGCQNVLWIEPTATDESSIPVLQERSHDPGDCFTAEPTLVTYQFADLEGNIAMCSFVVTIFFRDIDPPIVLGCPPDMTLRALAGDQCVVAQWDEPFAIDNRNGEIVTMQTSQPGSCLPIGNTLVSYIFTDGSGNVAACTFTITVFVLDVIPPTIPDCPNDIILEAVNNDQCVSISWIEPVGMDEGPGPVTIRDQTHFPGDCFPTGQTDVTYVLQDAAGNTASCTFSIIINPRDVTPPLIIICPRDITMELESNNQCLFVAWEEPLFIDDSPIDQVTITQTAFSGACFSIGIETVIYTFTDAAGNTAMCSFIVEIRRIDFSPPVVTNCPSDITLRKTPNLPCVSVTWIEPTVTDESLPIITEVTHALGTCFERGTTGVTYSFRDAAGNTAFCSFTILILILDDTPPDITFCPSDIVQSISPPATCAQLPFPLPTAVDDSQDPLTVIPSHNPGDCFNVGVTSVSYAFIDSSGNLATCMFNIQVNLADLLSPVITGCPSNIMLTLPPGETCTTAAWIPPTATDASGQVTTTVSVDQNTCFPIGQTEVIYTFRDAAGNAATCSFIVIIVGVDDVPPVITGCPSNIMLTLPPGETCTTAAWIPPTATDASGQVTTTVSVDQNTCFPVGQTEVIYTFRDAAGNAATCSFIVIIIGGDNTPPDITFCPSDIVQSISPPATCAELPFPLPTAVDNSQDPLTVIPSHNPGDCFNVGVTSVSYAFIDSSGNLATCIFNIQVNLADTCAPNPCFNGGTCVSTPTNDPPFTCLCLTGFAQNDCSEDTQPPSVTCQPDISITLATGETCAVVLYETPPATDNSGNNVIVMSSPQSGACFEPGTTIVQVTASDQSGNIDQCTFNVNVLQGANTPPSIPVCPTVLPVTSFPGNVGNLVMWTIPDCNDVEDGTITPVCNPLSNSFFNLGTSSVRCTCTDTGGLSTECTFNAVVVAVNAPPSTPVCPTVPAVTSFPGNTGNFVMWTIPDCTDAEDGTITPVCNPMSSSFFNLGSTTVTCTCTDTGGLSTECTFDAVVVGANTSPSIPVCPTVPPVTSFPGNVGNLVIWTIPDCTDAEDGAITPVCNPMSNTFFTVGTNPVTCTCTDSGGLSTECFFNAVVDVEVDTIRPELSPCPPDQTGVVLAGSCQTVNWTPPTATDNSGQVIVSSDIMPGFCFSIGETIVTYTATDPSNNIIQCTFTVTINQDQPPVVTGCPSDMVAIVPIGSTCVLVSWIEPTAVDDTGTVTPTLPTFMPNTCLVANTYTVVYVFTDMVNQQTTCMFQITVTPEQVIDTIPPEVLNCPMGDIVRYVQAGMTIPVTWMEPTAMDNSGLDVIITQNASPGVVFAVGSFRVTYTFMDQAGNLADPCQFLITVIEDNLPPIVMDCPQNIFVSVSLAEGGQVIMWNEPTAADDFGEPVAVEMTGRISGTFFEVGTNEIIVYTFTDAAGNINTCTFTVNVALSTDPLNIQDCPMDLTLSAEPGQVSVAASWTIPTATGVMPITVESPLQQPGDQIQFGNTEIVYRFTDANNQVAECQFAITVIVTPLILDCPTSFTQEAPPGSVGALVSWTEPTPMGLEPFMTVFPDTRPPIFLPPGDTVITYIFTDNLGQGVTCQFTVTINVLDSPPIVISGCPASFTADAPPGQSTVVAFWTIPTATGFDPVFLTSVPPFTPSVTPLTVGMDVTLTYTFTDGLGMTADCTFTITPRDVTPPSFVINCPVLPVVQFIGPMDENTVVPWTVPVAVDDIPGGMVTAIVTPDSDIFTEGSTLVTYTFSDAARNSIMCNFTVTVIVDNIPPTITSCPMTITANADPNLNGQFVTWNTPTATDNVELSPNVDVTGGISNTVFPVGVATITYRFSDIFGNTADCIFMVEVIGDTTLPVISGCPLEPVSGYTAVGVPSTVNWVPPTATDIGGGTITTTSSHTPNQSVFQPATTTTVTYTFTDVFGNAAMCIFQVILLEDSLPPTVENCPQDILINLEPGVTQAMAQWIAPTGIDNSALAVTVVRDGPPSGSLFPIDNTVITYTLTDSVGLTSLCSFTVAVRDVTPPQILNCPTEDLVRYSMIPILSVELPVLQVTDDTGAMPLLVSSSVPAQNMFQVGSFQVVFVYSDNSNNVATCDYTVTVIFDTISPVVVCPDTVQVFVPIGVTTTPVTYPNPTVTDNSGLTPTLIATIGMASGSQFPVGNSFVSFQYEDAAGNQGSCTLQIMVTVDNTPPTISSCTPTAMAFASITNLQAVVMFVEPTATDNSGLEVTMTVDGFRSGSLFPAGVSTTVYTFTDSVGNPAICETIVTVEVDVIPPTIMDCPTNIVMSVPNTDTQGLVTFTTPFATDNSGETPRLSGIIGVTADNMYPVGTTIITYTFEDNYGNSAVCQFTITISQEVCNPSPCAVNEVCTSDGANPPMAVCTPTGPCESNPCNPFLEFCLESPFGGFLCAPNGNTPTIPVVNNCPTSDITEIVAFTVTPPVFVNTPVPTTTTAGATVAITGLPNGNLFPEGSTLITYTFTSPDTGQSVCSFSVIVDVDYCNPNPCGADTMCTEGSPIPSQVVCLVPTDTTEPVITGCPTTAITQTVPTTTNLPVFVNTPVPTATDNSNVTPTMTVTGLPAGNSFPEGTTVVTYTFTDGSSNQAVCSFSVIVDVDYCSPNPCTGGLACTEGSPTPSQVICAGPCESNPCNPFLEFCLESPFGGFLCAPNGNTPTIPVVNNCPTSDITEIVASTVTPPVLVTTPVPTTTTAGATVAITGLPNGNLFPEGSTLVTYTFTSPDTGQSVCSFSVIVDVDYCNPNPCGADTACTEGSPIPSQVVCLADNIPPVVTACPDARTTITVDRGITEFFVIPNPQPAATDNSNLVNTEITGRPANDMYPVGETTVTYTFTDPAGNTAICTFIIEIVVDVCSPNPCLANQICVLDASVEGFFCGNQCIDTTTCTGQYCFSSIGLMTGSPCVDSLTQPLLASCPPETVVALAPFGTTAATVVLPVPFLFNFPNYLVTVSQVPPGDSFGIGDTTVFQFITDDVGSPISICQRTVTVSAAPAPGFMLSNCDPSTFITRYVAGGITDVQVFFDEPTTVGGQGTVSLSVGQLRSGSTFPVGVISTVTFTFTDETASTLQCSRFIDVIVDAIAPTISGCTTPIITRTVDRTTTSTVVIISPQPTAVDNINLPVILTQSGFPDNNVYMVGSTVVSYIFRDSVGNTATCEINIIVDQDFCNPFPCGLQESCAEDNSVQGFSCTVTSPCDSSPCAAGEICFEVLGTFVCDTGTGRRRRSIDWRDEDRQRRSASSIGEVSLDEGSSSNVILSYIFIILVSIAAILSTAIITVWYHWKKSERGQRSMETASSNI